MIITNMIKFNEITSSLDNSTLFFAKLTSNKNYRRYQISGTPIILVLLLIEETIYIDWLIEYSSINYSCAISGEIAFEIIPENLRADAAFFLDIFRLKNVIIGD